VNEGSGNIIPFTFHVPEPLGSFGSSYTENLQKKIVLTGMTITAQNCTPFILYPFRCCYWYRFYV